MSNGQTLVGKYVKHVSINFNNSDNGVLDLIDFSFPQLEDITLFADLLCYSYFCKMITDDGKFSSLKQIPYPKSKDQCEYYKRCLIFMRDRLDRINLYHDDSSEKDRTICTFLLDNLDQFSNIKTVTVSAQNSVTQNIPTYLDTILEKNSGSI